MSGFSFPVTRPTGRALLVGHSPSRDGPRALLGMLGIECDESNDVYSAFAHLCGSAQMYHAVVLILPSLYPEELPAIATIRQRFPDLEVWLANADAHAPFLEQAIQLGAAGLLSEDGLKRIALPPAAESGAPVPEKPPAQNGSAPSKVNGIFTSGTSTGAMELRPKPTVRFSESEVEVDSDVPQPLLSAEELRALLHDDPVFPPD